MVEAETDFWSEYQQQLRHPDLSLFEEFYNIADLMAADRAVILGGIFLAGGGMLAAKFLERRQAAGIFQGASRGIALGGLTILGLGLAGEMLGRKAVHLLEIERSRRRYER